MPTPLKKDSKLVKDYYKELNDLLKDESSELTVRRPMDKLLGECASKRGWIFKAEKKIDGGRRPDGVIETKSITLYWEAKDEDDNLDKEIEDKITDGYPQCNILYTTPSKAVLYNREGARHQEIIGPEIARAENLCGILNYFFKSAEENVQDWQRETEQFKENLPKISKKIEKAIQKARHGDQHFKICFERFAQQMRQAVNPNVSEDSLVEMLIQHLLTADIFNAIFGNHQTLQKNEIAQRLEEMVDVLTRKYLKRSDFLGDVSYYYELIKKEAKNLPNSTEQLFFLHGIYERFFQAYLTKDADTHGIVYTPQPIVDYMVEAVDQALQKDFGLPDGIGAAGVHIIDPFCGTGHFLRRIMLKLAEKGKLKQKYGKELHANEVLLLPYYIALLQAELTYYEAIKEYKTFEGLCLVDTFELSESRQAELGLTEQDTKRIEAQQAADIMVIISNPPYNANQDYENDNNKNRRYPILDQRIRDTYSKHSQATLKNKLYDPYVRAMRWASDRINKHQQKQGLVCLVTNNAFLEGIATDGLRKCLLEDYNEVSIVDFGGNVRKNSKLSGTKNNVFGIKLGVSINLSSRLKKAGKGKLRYLRTGEEDTKEQKYQWLNDLRGKIRAGKLSWQVLKPDEDYTWLNQGNSRFKQLPALGTKQGKYAKPGVAKTLFKQYSGGVLTSRDAWCWNFCRNDLAENLQKTIDFYNDQVGRWIVAKRQANVPERKEKEAFSLFLDDFVDYDNEKLSWDGTLKESLSREKLAEYDQAKIREGLDRPFTKKHLFFDRIFNNSVYRQPYFFPTATTENKAICVSGVGGDKPFQCLMVNSIPSFDLLESTQCFPYYTYAEDGTGRQENLTDWGLEQYCHRYGKQVSKEAVFDYIYAVLHHASWREVFQHNLKRALPRIAWAKEREGFAQLARLGAELSALHLNYGDLAINEYFEIKEEWREGGNRNNYRIEKMKWAGKNTIVVNKDLSLSNIPASCHNWQLGTRSALDWLIDRLRVKVDKKSQIENDPNRSGRDNIKLVKQVAQVASKTSELMSSVSEVKLEGI